MGTYIVFVTTSSKSNCLATQAIETENTFTMPIISGDKLRDKDNHFGETSNE